MPQFLLIGVGGLGCPALLGLVAGGARRFTLVDGDRVEASNLQRQVLFRLSDVGVPKVHAARWSIGAQLGADARAELHIRGFYQRLDPDPGELESRLTSLLEPEHRAIVLECSDDPALKFSVHDACVRLGHQLVVGGVVGWQGQVMAIDPKRRDRACYRCVFESPPPPELAPSCAAVGVIGAVAGQVGHAMAAAALALASDGPSPAGHLTHFDLLRMRVQQLGPAPQPSCPVCGSGGPAPR